jgi:glycerol-3-phosphate dehydrogenase (NAD(P)+)
MRTHGKDIAVVGSGSWGTTLAYLLARMGRATALLVRTPQEAEHLLARGEHERAAPGVPIPPQLLISADVSDVLAAAEVVLLAVPSQRMRPNVRAIRDALPPNAMLLSCAKGIEQGSLLRMSEVIAEEVGDEHRVGALSGPNIAHEILAGKPAVSVIALPNADLARRAQVVLTTPTLRIYTSDDVVGVELGGTLKNVIALGAGIADGMEAGDNAKAAFITRGLAEITRLGLAYGANPLTFAGLAGLGDLVATCASPYSRNRRMGQALAEGLTLDEAQAQLGQVVEGVTTVTTARSLAARHGIEMPITDQLHAILWGGKDPRQAMLELMQREAKDERAGIGLGE